MEGKRIISEEEEARFRRQVRKDLAEGLELDQQEETERRRRQDEEARLTELDRIRRDEEVKFYTEKGFVATGQSIDDSIRWQRIDDTGRAARKRRKHHRPHRSRFSVKKYVKEIVFFLTFLGILMILIIYYNS